MILKRRKSRARVIATLIVILGMVLSLGGQDAHPLASVSIEALKSEFVAGSIVSIKVLFKNETDQKIMVPSTNNGLKESGIIVWDQDGKEVPPREENLREGSYGSRFAVILNPGESKAERVNLTRWFDLRNPGQYVVQIRRRMGNNMIVESNKFSFTVVPKK